MTEFLESDAAFWLAIALIFVGGGVMLYAVKRLPLASPDGKPQAGMAVLIVGSVIGSLGAIGLAWPPG